jgi:hypothetical protein
MMQEMLLWSLQVYAGGIEFSFEELRAIEYLKGNRPLHCKQGKNINMLNCNGISYCRRESYHFFLFPYVW